MKYKTSKHKREYAKEYSRRRRAEDEDFRKKDNARSNKYTKEHTEEYRNKMRKRLHIPKSKWRKE